MVILARSPDPISRVARASVFIALVVTAIKAAASMLTGSVALYSDALEGGVNVASALAVLLAVEYARHPPDDDHPYGHEKAEYLAAGFEGGLIVLAAVLILYQASKAFFAAPELHGLGAGAAVNAIAAVINAGWGWYLVSRGRAWGSAALTADGLHVLTDVWTSVGVLAGLALAWLTGAWWLDPLMAVAVALYILWAGYGLMRSSASGLLDEAASPEVQHQVATAIRSHGVGAIQAHRVRTRKAGRMTFIEFHLVVPGSMTVEAAHAICDRIEHAVESAIPKAEVLIHIEPAHEAGEDGAIAI